MPVSTIKVIVQDSLVGVAFLIIIWIVSPLLSVAVKDETTREQLHRIEQWGILGSYCVIVAGGFARLFLRVAGGIIEEWKIGDGDTALV